MAARAPVSSPQLGSFFSLTTHLDHKPCSLAGCNPCWSQSQCGYQGSCPAVYCHRSYERGTLSPDTVAAETRKIQQDVTSPVKVARVLGSFKESSVHKAAVEKRDAGPQTKAETNNA